MRRVARLIGFLTVCLGVLAVIAIGGPLLSLARQERRRRLFMAGCHRLWARTLLWMLNIAVVAEGVTGEAMATPHLLVSNHLGYLDVLIIGAYYPTTFVAKSEVAGWPLLGWLARLGGTIFLRRGDTASNVGCVYRVSRRLRDGDHVHLFPEGTTGDGRALVPFNPLFFASAVRAGAPILPLTLQVRQVNDSLPYDEACELFCWYGDTLFLPHFWNLLRIDSARIALIQHEPIGVTRKDRARSIALRAEGQIAESFYSHGQAGHGTLTGENEMPVEFIAGALLFSLVASQRSESVREMIPANEE